MLYKVTPSLAPAETPSPKPEGKKTRGPRKRRKSAVYDADGNEVLVSLTCLKCRQLKPLAQFGLRKMGDGAIRNQPWCRGCRSGAGTKGKKPEAQEIVVPEAVTAPVRGLPEHERAPAAPVSVASAPAEAPAAPAAVVAGEPAPPVVAVAPAPSEPVSPWMAAIASLRAAVTRPATTPSDAQLVQDETKG